MWPQLIDLLQRLEKAYALLYKSAQEKKGALIMLELQMVQQLNEQEEKLTPCPLLWVLRISPRTASCCVAAFTCRSCCCSSCTIVCIASSPQIVSLL